MATEGISFSTAIDELQLELEGIEDEGVPTAVGQAPVHTPPRVFLLPSGSRTRLRLVYWMHNLLLVSLSA